MNNILQLKGKIHSKPASAYGGDINLPKSGYDVTVEKIIALIDDLKDIYKFWDEHKDFGGALISVHHNKILAKSNRIKRLFKKKGKTSNSMIVGAKFDVNKKNNKHCHIFTYFLDLDVVKDAIDILEMCSEIIKEEFDGIVNYNTTVELNKNKIELKIKTDDFLKIILDVCYIDFFNIERYNKEVFDENLVTLYETNILTEDYLKQLNINVNRLNKIDKNTYLLKRNELERVINEAPFLIAMGVNNFTEIPPVLTNNINNDLLTIPDPIGDEPIVGVIDTCFYKDVYFKNWVTVERYIDKNITIDDIDYEHGTEVTSIIVDGPSFNPNLQDNCGRFRVKHFEVSKAKGFSSITIMKCIEEIVESNRDIKVWNLSLGSNKEVEENFISPAGSFLDKLQNKYDIIFVIAGTNKNGNVIKIGAPADSLNSIVVNSVDFDNKPASYTRFGPVLSFFLKPDVAYYGGDKNKIVVCTPYGKGEVIGTSFAAPWITRKVAYIIYKLNLNRELAKALIIDAAMGWNDKISDKCDIGFGIVPKDINDIIHSKNDEIKFFITDSVEKFENYSYELPVPKVDNTHPFVSRATLVYFPVCNRNQGVDYTQTELDLSFGRMKDESTIITINKNIQSDAGTFTNEEESRKYFRKWDNVKHICDKKAKRVVARKAYESGLWGINIRCKERVDGKNGKGMRYGVLITLREINGKNRIEEFKNLCISRGWFVYELNVENRLNIYNKLNEDIVLE